MYTASAASESQSGEVRIYNLGVASYFIFLCYFILVLFQCFHSRIYSLLALGPGLGLRTSSYAINLPKTIVKSHGNNACDVIIVHVISGGAQTMQQTNRHTDAENVKQCYDQPAM